MEEWLQRFARASFERSGDTAHDLKTPLNVAVLNLELLRMRLRKLAGDDEKLQAYAASVELELRRMAAIFDAYFLLSVPPKNDAAPSVVDAAAIAVDTAAAAGFNLNLEGAALVMAHEARIRQAFRLFFEGATKILEQRRASADHDSASLSLVVTGVPVGPDFELTKIFKFYYTDPLGNPDLSLATARLIAETYGGRLVALEERDNVTLRLSLPLGEE